MVCIYFLIVVGLVFVSGEKHCHKQCLHDTECDHGHYCRVDLEGCHSECMSSRNDLPPPVIGKRNTGCSQVPVFCPQPCMVNRGGCTVCDCTGGRFSTGQNSPFHATNLGNPVQLSQMGPMAGQGNSANQMSQMPAQSNSVNTGPGSGSLNGPNTPNFNPGNPGGGLPNGLNGPNTAPIQNGPNTGPIQNGPNTGPIQNGPNTGPIQNGPNTGPIQNGPNTGPIQNGPNTGPIQNGPNTGPIQNGPNTGPIQIGGGIKLDQILKSTHPPSSVSQTSTPAPTTTKITCAPVRCIAPCNKGVTISKDGCPTCLC
ncbi:protein pygopus-like [Mytilus trossulus]|uniref:protein pygopus-like n=1 Tax=Mytilus trossulus TaxID=6551 RepID=UPI003007F0E1